jgi:hypothetical protein
MTENTATQEVKSDALTDEQKQNLWNGLPKDMQATITQLIEEANQHNANVTKLQSSEKKDPQLIKAEVFEQSTNPKIARLRKEELKLMEQIEALRKQGYALIDSEGLMPAELTEDAIAQLKKDVAESQKDLKNKVGTLEAMEAFGAMFKGLTQLVPEIKTRRGTSTKSSSSSGETRRPRFKRIEINGIVEDDKGNKVYGVDKDGNEKHTFTFASKYLRSMHKDITWQANDLADKYYEGEDENNLPAVKEFPMVHTYKDENGNDQTITFTVKAYRPDPT